jgi:hypothetical protein
MNVHESPFDELDALQLWMQTVITHPAGVKAALASKNANQIFDIREAEIERVIQASETLGAIQRLEIYANAYFARLSSCLRDEFPAFANAVGDKAFQGFASEYLRSFPSNSYTLSALGRSFPSFLRATRPADLSFESLGPTWADFLIDLATVERAYSEVFDGPGIEHERVADPQDLASLTVEQWLGARLTPAPCLRLLQLSYPVHEYISDVRRGRNPPAPTPSKTYLVITRRNYLVRRSAVGDSEFMLLTALANGSTVGDGVAFVAQQNQSTIDALEFELTQWFRNWAEAGYFRQIMLA